MASPNFANGPRTVSSQRMYWVIAAVVVVALAVFYGRPARTVDGSAAVAQSGSAVAPAGGTNGTLANPLPNTNPSAPNGLVPAGTPALDANTTNNNSGYQGNTVGSQGNSNNGAVTTGTGPATNPDGTVRQ